jgi:hypothetical protein
MEICAQIYAFYYERLIESGRLRRPSVQNLKFFQKNSQKTQKKFAGKKKLSIFAAIQQKINTFIQKTKTKNVNRRPSYRHLDFR